MIRTWIGRGSRRESRHDAVALAIPQRGGALRFGGAIPGTYLRSAAKPFQTLALFRAGVVDHHGLTDAEIAVITASHGGEPEHCRRVEGILRRGGFTMDDLRCGTHAPFTASERRRMLADGEAPNALCNNCSGKHAGMLLHSRRLGADPERYLEADHPVQRAVTRVLETLTDQEFAPEDCAVDGCGAPTWYLSLETMTRAFSRLSDRTFLADHDLTDAVDRMHRALRAQPLLFSGEQRFPYLWSAYLAPEHLSKEGAEGLFVIWGERGALVVKALDGSERGYRYAVPALLGRLGWLEAGPLRRWREADPAVVKNVVGREVGEITVELPEPEVLAAR